MSSAIEGEITSLAMGGQGILKHEGLVVFVPMTAPGDKIVATLTKTRKNWAEGTLQKLLLPSPHRETPRCPYYEKCGGCQLQHVTYETELASKKQSVKDALERIGKIALDDFEIEAAPSIWGYRQRIALNLRGGKIGYLARDNKTLVEIGECPIFLKEPSPLFNELKEAAKLISEEGRVELLKDHPFESPHRFIAYFHLTSARDLRALKELSSKLLSGSLSGLHLSAPGSSYHSGRFELEADLEGLQMSYNPKVFIQNNRPVSLSITKTLVSWFKFKGSGKLLDLYCGIGLSSLLLAKKGFEVVGVESNKESIRLARQNGAANGLERVKFYADKVEEKLPSLLKEGLYESALVNPPREGLYPEVVEALNRSSLKEVIYLSCMPSTLARDVEKLASGGFRVKKVKAFDMFPRTGHIETLIQMVRD